MFHARDHLMRFADRPCLIHDGEVLCYGDLAEAAARAAARMPGRRGLIGVEMRPEPRAIATYLGALQAGHAVMPLPVDQPDLARTLARRFRPAALWSRQDGRWRGQVLDNAAALHPDLALLMQTSGSTGQGRGVRLSARAVAANAASIVDYLRLDAEARAGLVLPLHYSYGLSVLHSHLAVGASLWLAPGSVLDAGFLPGLAQAGATSLAGVPHHFRMLDGIGGAGALPPSLRCLTVAGGAMPAADVARWARAMKARGGAFVVMYGQTEATARIAWLPPEHAMRAPDAVGQAIPGGQLLLRDAQGREITAPGVEGELVYRGPNVMMGYADQAADLRLGPGLDELATGDLARRGADGLYRITGRLSRMSKIAGLRIGHDALERALGGDHAVWGDDATIWVARPAGPAAESAADLAARAAALAGIGRQHVQVLECPALPRRPNGKIDYPALRRLAADSAAPGPEARSVQALFQRCFPARAIGPEDSFASLGGDSLQHVELSLLLDRRLSGLPEGWENLPIRALESARPRPGARVPMPVLARALAILAVVVSHQTGWPVYGGAAAMMLLLGMSVAQHRRQALAAGDWAAFLRPSLRVLVPYGLVLAGFALAWHQVPWVSVLMLGNFALTTPETHLMLPYLYWFVEAYVQITLLLALLFWPPPARRWLARDPLAAGLGLLALACLLRLTLPEFWPLPAGRSQFSVPWVFYLFALGWCIACADSRRARLGVMAAAAVILPVAAYLGGNWYGGWIKYLSLLALVAALLTVRAVPMPRPMVRLAMHLAQAAFPIYLLHRLVPEVLMPRAGLHLDPAMTDLVAVLGGIALGWAAAQAQGWLSAQWSFRSPGRPAATAR
ncbi:AMP-binding protein (plasmid) [Paracoccus sp. SMMA_5_TC]|nr:AMP-binding protein [Paracoccus sp. SMMA_5_TC]UXU82515.1 AMP-binding protein [Paracoccus sp. SMMA_5_TC]